MNPSDYLTRKQLAERWRREPRTLANLASMGKGPKYDRLHDGRVVYALTDIEAYEAANAMWRTQE